MAHSSPTYRGSGSPAPIEDETAKNEHQMATKRKFQTFLFSQIRQLLGIMTTQPRKKTTKNPGTPSRVSSWCRRWESNPHSTREHDFESCASANSATSACLFDCRDDIYKFIMGLKSCQGFLKIFCRKRDFFMDSGTSPRTTHPACQPSRLNG
jgi:hypothetical protein